MESSQLLTPDDPQFPVKAQADRADAHLVVFRNEQASATCSLWWNETACLDGDPIGAIGHYEASDPVSAKVLLSAATDHLRDNGISQAVGPLDGNTWRRYRLVTHSEGENPFCLEPTNPPTYVEHFLDSSFSPLSTYFSALASDLSITDDRLPKTQARIERTGVRIRPLDSCRLEEELVSIYEVSCSSFHDNFLYTPIQKEAFVNQYLALRKVIDPRLILLAELDGRCVGYVFAIPDYLQKERGEMLDTVVLKTVACLPGRHFAGLGVLLVGLLHQTAHKEGFKRIIHALMHETNNSRNISAHYTREIRRYALFSRSLA